MRLSIKFLIIWSCTCFTLNTARFSEPPLANSKPNGLSDSHNHEVGNGCRVVRKCFPTRKSSKKKLDDKMLDHQEDLEAIKRLIAIGKTKQRSAEEPNDWIWLRNRESSEIVGKPKREIANEGIQKIERKTLGLYRNTNSAGSKGRRRRRNRVSELKHIGKVSKIVGNKIISDPVGVETKVRTLKYSKKGEKAEDEDAEPPDSPDQNRAPESINDEETSNEMPQSKPKSRIQGLQKYGSEEIEEAEEDPELQKFRIQNTSSGHLSSKSIKQEMSPDICDEKPADLENQFRSQPDREPVDMNSLDPLDREDQDSLSDREKGGGKIMSKEKKFVVTNFRKYVMNFLCPHCGGEISVSRGRTKGLFNVRDDVRVHKSDADMIMGPTESSWPRKDLKKDD